MTCLQTGHPLFGTLYPSQSCQVLVEDMFKWVSLQTTESCNAKVTHSQ